MFWANWGGVGTFRAASFYKEFVAGHHADRYKGSFGCTLQLSNLTFRVQTMKKLLKSWRQTSRQRLSLFAVAVAVAVAVASPATAQQQGLFRFQEADILGGFNNDRTKDADIADINRDGNPDIYDANSQVGMPGLGSDAIVIRFNNGKDASGVHLGFRVVDIDPGDMEVTYDSDFADFNGDGYPELIRTQGNEVAVYLNQQGPDVWFDFDNPFGNPDTFIDTPGDSPDDIAVGDLDNDGDLDFAVARRIRPGVSVTSGSGVEIYINEGFGAGGANSSELPSFRSYHLDVFDYIADSIFAGVPEFFSTHDVFFVDANGDNYLDIVAVNEDGFEFEGESFGGSQLFLNNANGFDRLVGDVNRDGQVNLFDIPPFVLVLTSGAFQFEADVNGDGIVDFSDITPLIALITSNQPPTAGQFFDDGQFFQAAVSGAGAKFDEDNFNDLIFTGNNKSSVYLNDPSSPGKFFAPTTLPDSEANPGDNLVRIYDVEIGDIDNDGDLDAVAPVMDIAPGVNGTARVWRNDSGVFTLFGGRNPLTGLEVGTILSADFIDFDSDGDLDLYMAGNDGIRAQNRFFINNGSDE